MTKGSGDSSTDRKELFVDLSEKRRPASSKGAVLGVSPRFQENRKYYVNYHVRNQGSHFSPIIAERTVTADLRKDAGGKSGGCCRFPKPPTCTGVACWHSARRVPLHWAGDAGAPGRSRGNGQNLSVLTGSILRIDVDERRGPGLRDSQGQPVSETARQEAPGHLAKAREEIWAYGLRMPWRV
ncbi:MAG: hypothetical protein CM1200mP2_16600 [Planctomycetaceae bacterium]|nr:MAG: hypothetical protein CM1200mP2_16600 [Planctomycetaceae bacterium]